jgi:type VI secretion system protein ImpJ
MPRISPEVVWEDGLLLQPHHLQAMQRHFSDLAAYLVNTRAFGYGVRTLEIRKESVANWVLEVGSCDLVMPDGTVVVVGETAVIQPLEFRHMQHDAATLEVWLAVPFGSDNTPSLAEEAQIDGTDPSASTRRYFAGALEHKDENTGGDGREIRVRRLNGRIFVGARPPEGYATLKIAELDKVVTDEEGGRRYELSDRYVPACLRLDAAPALHALVKDMLDRLETKNAELLGHLRGDRSLHTGDSLQTPATLLKLQATNGVLPLLRQIAAQPAMHPFDVYLQLCRLAGDLAIVSDQWDSPKLVIYDHDDPLRAFADLKSKWLQLLEKAVESRIDKRHFEPSGEQQGVLEAEVPAHFLEEGVELFLGVKTDLPRQEIGPIFSGARTVLAAPENITLVRHRRIPGILCSADDEIPASLSSRKGYCFLRIQQEGEFWEIAKGRQRLALAGDVLGDGELDFYLYAANVRRSASAGE